MQKNLNRIISESIRKSLNEMDIVPLSKNGEPNMVRNQSLNAWRMIYNLMDNVKEAMDHTYKYKGSSIANKDVVRITDYICDSLKGIIKNTIGE